MHVQAPKYMFDPQLCVFMLEYPCRRLIMHVWAPLSTSGSHSCLIVPEDACWDPNIDDIASIFSFEPGYAGSGTKVFVNARMGLMAAKYECLMLYVHVFTQRWLF